MLANDNISIFQLLLLVLKKTSHHLLFILDLLSSVQPRDFSLILTVKKENIKIAVLDYTCKQCQAFLGISPLGQICPLGTLKYGHKQFS